MQTTYSPQELIRYVEVDTEYLKHKLREGRSVYEELLKPDYNDLTGNNKQLAELENNFDLLEEQINRVSNLCESRIKRSVACFDQAKKHFGPEIGHKLRMWAITCFADSFFSIIEKIARTVSEVLRLCNRT